MTETVERTSTGAILYDRQIINQISEERFLPEGWLHSELITGKLGSGGRGNTYFVGNVPRQFVLRHFVRGGLIGRFNRDNYFWTGENEVRAFAEWRLLAKMADFDLRVPRPAAARYVRRGTFYRADIITVRIPDVRPLSSVIAESARDDEFWDSVGKSIHEFHAAGVFHADMNAYNLQIDAQDRLWMLDFDKGQLRQPGAWQQKTLDRLHRSLIKIRTRYPNLHFGQREWQALLDGYFEASKSSA